jgi:hypothetical protein
MGPMVGRRHAIRVLCAGLLAFVGSSCGQTGGRLQPVLEAFKQQSTAEQYKQVSDAIAASPALARELGAAADAGRLKGIRVADEEHPPEGPFLATIVDGWIVFTPGFLWRIERKPPEFTAHPDDIVPDNLVFVLGAFAFYLTNPAGPRPATKEAFMQAAVERDARAFLNGWNDVVDWATRGNRNKPLSIEQTSLMMDNLRYKHVFSNYTGVFKKLDWSPGGRLEPNDRNVAAVAEGLHKMVLLDFGVPPLSPP